MKHFGSLFLAGKHAVKSIAAMVLVSTALLGCSKTPPTCIEESTVTLVRQAFEESLQKDLSTSSDPALLDRLKKRIQIAITAIRTSNKDDKIGKVSCDASLQITLANADQIVADPVFKSLQTTKRIPDSINTSGPAWTSERKVSNYLRQFFQIV